MMKAKHLLLLPSLAAATYYGSYNNNVQKMIDAAYGPRTSVFRTTSFTTDDLKTHWRLSNATGRDVDGMLEFAADAWPQNASAQYVYGTLWFDAKLPLDGIVVEWSFMYRDALAAHDMNWWFPCARPTNDVYSALGKTSPFYVWGAHGWGGLLSGVERSDGGDSLVQAAPAAPGVMHSALYYSSGGSQYFFLVPRPHRAPARPATQRAPTGGARDGRTASWWSSSPTPRRPRRLPPKALARGECLIISQRAHSRLSHQPHRGNAPAQDVKSRVLASALMSHRSPAARRRLLRLLGL